MRNRRLFAVAPLNFALCLSPAALADAAFHDDFESGTSAWLLTGTWGTSMSLPRAGTYSLTDSPSTNYVGNSSTTATLAAPIDLSAATSPRLTFWIRYSSETLHDYLHVETSKDGTAWQTQDSYTGTSSPTTWRQIDISLPGYEHTATFYIRFRVQTDALVNDNGWYVDDLIVDDGNPAVLVTAPAAGAAWAGKTTQVVTWTYDGTFSPMAKSIDITYSVDGFNYNLTQFGLPIDATRYSWTVPAVDGPQARVRVQLLDALGTVLTWGTSAPFVIDSIDPGPVALLAPASGGCVSGAPTFDWNDASGAANYTLTLWPASGPSWEKTGITTSTYTLAPGEALSSADNPYNWTVTAFDAAGNSTASQSPSFTVDTSPPASFALSSPPDAAVVPISGLTFGWQATSDVGCSGLAKHRLYIDGNLCADDIAPSSTSIALASTSCAALSNGAHTWTVSAVDGAGNTTWSSASPNGSGGFHFTISGPVPEAGVPPDAGADASTGGASSGGNGGSSGSGGNDAGAAGGRSGGSGAGGNNGSAGAGGVAAGGAGDAGSTAGGATSSGTGGRAAGAGGAVGSSGSGGRSGNAGTAGSADQASDGGPAAAAASGDSGGCGCRTSARGSRGALASLLLILAIARRRRKGP